jgi:hypothetical protein
MWHPHGSETMSQSDPIRPNPPSSTPSITAYRVYLASSGGPGGIQHRSGARECGRPDSGQPGVAAAECSGGRDRWGLSSDENNSERSLQSAGGRVAGGADALEQAARLVATLLHAGSYTIARIVAEGEASAGARCSPRITANTGSRARPEKMAFE